jgi:hypothetical protein
LEREILQDKMKDIEDKIDKFAETMARVNKLLDRL